MSIPNLTSQLDYENRIALFSTATLTDVTYNSAINEFQFTVPTNTSFTTGTGEDTTGNGNTWAFPFDYIKDPLGLITNMGVGSGFGSTGDSVFGNVTFTDVGVGLANGTFSTSTGKNTFGDCTFSGFDAFYGSTGYNTFGDCTFSDTNAFFSSFGINILGNCTFSGFEAFSNSTGNNILGNCTFSGDSSFNASLGNNTFGNCTFSGTFNFQYSTGNNTFGDCNLIGYQILHEAIGVYTFNSITALSNNLFASTNNPLTINVLTGNKIGQTTGQDCPNFTPTGNVTFNVPIAMQTSNGGNPDGDLDNASMNPMNTVNYIY